VSGRDGATTRAVLFDLDGVLVDSFEVWFAVVRETLEAFGHPPLSRARMEAIFGQGISADVMNLYPGRAAGEVRAAYEAALPRHADRMTVNPEARAVLEALGRRGIGRAVVTNTQSSLAGGVLERARLDDVVDAVSALGGSLREKPHPDLLLDALARLSVPPARARMVGDTHYDEMAAHAAGVPFLLFEIRRGGSLLAALGDLTRA
jgi:phosphoglycolate phosphatase/AHBA synthesis associated protein